MKRRESERARESAANTRRRRNASVDQCLGMWARGIIQRKRRTEKKEEKGENNNSIAREQRGLREIGLDLRSTTREASQDRTRHGYKERHVWQQRTENGKLSMLQIQIIMSTGLSSSGLSVWPAVWIIICLYL